jgi:SAM-dependent methyltransferase
MIIHVKKFVVNNFPLSSRKIYHTVNKFIYRGKKYYCPICERGFRRFLPGPDKIKNNSKCPGCSSLERHRLLWLYLKDEMNIFNSKIKLLNIAPDYATQNKLKKLVNINYTSVDLDSHLAMQKADLTNLPFEENMFNAIICYHVLEHIEDDSKAMSEILRVLRPGGWAILQSPIDTNREKTFEDFKITSPQERKKIFGQEDHVRIYGKDYSLRLKNAGFIVKEDDFINKLSETETQKFVLDKNEMIFFCKKQVNQESK